MEDTSIVDLYFQRNQQAITETAAKYGGYCSVVASNLPVLPRRSCT